MSVVSAGVHNPKHYTEGRKYQPWDVAKDWDLSFDLGSVLKYIGRCGRKSGESRLKDLEKAAEFLAHEIEAEKEIQKAKDAEGLKTVSEVVPDPHPNCRCELKGEFSSDVPKDVVENLRNKAMEAMRSGNGVMMHIVAPKDMPKEMIMKIAEQEIEKILGDDRK